MGRVPDERTNGWLDGYTRNWKADAPRRTRAKADSQRLSEQGKAKKQKKLRVARSALLELDQTAADRMRTSQTAKTLGPLTSSASTAHPCSVWPPAYPLHPFISHYCALCCPAEVCRVHGLRNCITTALERSTHLTVYSSASPMRLHS